MPRLRDWSRGGGLACVFGGGGVGRWLKRGVALGQGDKEKLPLLALSPSPTTKKKGNSQTSLALIVPSSSPTLTIGAIAPSAPSSSPTPNSPSFFFPFTNPPILLADLQNVRAATPRLGDGRANRGAGEVRRHGVEVRRARRREVVARGAAIVSVFGGLIRSLTSRYSVNSFFRI